MLDTMNLHLDLAHAAPSGVSMRLGTASTLLVLPGRRKVLSLDHPVELLLPRSVARQQETSPPDD